MRVWGFCSPDRHQPGVVELGTRQGRGCGTRDAPRPDVHGYVLLVNRKLFFVLKIVNCVFGSGWPPFFHFSLETLIICWPPLDDVTFLLLGWPPFFHFSQETFVICWPPLGMFFGNVPRECSSGMFFGGDVARNPAVFSYVTRNCPGVLACLGRRNSRHKRCL